MKVLIATTLAGLATALVSWHACAQLEAQDQTPTPSKVPGPPALNPNAVLPGGVWAPGAPPPAFFPGGPAPTPVNVIGGYPSARADWVDAKQEPMTKVYDEVRQLLPKLKETTGTEREQVLAKYRQSLATLFDVDLSVREKQLGELEKRVAKLKEQLAKRKEQREKIIDLQIQVAVNEADGLGLDIPSGPSAGFDMLWMTPNVMTVRGMADHPTMELPIPTPPVAPPTKPSDPLRP